MIPFIDLKEQYRRLEHDINTNIKRVLEHGNFIMGPEVYELERKLQEYTDVKHAITCSSGTDALLMPLMAWGIKKGDAVFTTAFTFVATAEVIQLLGATPVFVDINSRSFNIDPGLLEKRVYTVAKKGKLLPKAVIPVDLFGLPADYDEIGMIAYKYGLKILEDAAQGFGGIYKGRRAGSLGDAAAVSFFPSKPLGCYGDGGAVFTNDDSLADALRSIRVHGQGRSKYDNVRTGINGRLDTIQAAVLLAKLGIFDDELLARNKIAKKYTNRLKDLVKTPEIPGGLFSSWALYPVLAKDEKERDYFMEKLKASGIPAAVYYPLPLHLQKVYKDLGYMEGDLPVSEETSRRILNLPMHPYLPDEVIEKVFGALTLKP